MAVADLIREQYPSLAFLISNPEIGPLLKEAVDPNRGFSPQTFQAKLYQTKWWRSQSATGREWLIKSKTDPGTANLERSEYRVALVTAAQRYGIKLTKDQINWLTEVGLGRGTPPDGPWMLSQFSSLVNSKNASGGMRRTSARDVQHMARGEYFYKMSKSSAAIWGDRIARGLATPDDVRTAVADKVAKLYPQFASGLQQGYTLNELTDGHRQIIADELELDPQRIDFTEGRWAQVLGKKDKNGQLTPMTAHETLVLARQDPRYWKTSKGRETDAQWASTILGMFGKRAPMGIS